jgi:hypothetical protein
MVRYAKSFIDELYEKRDVFTLDGVIDVVSRRRDLPQQFALFRKLLAWAGSTRSGVWQYYESTSHEEFESTASALELFGLPEFATHYRAGMASWKLAKNCDELDHWIDTHWSKLEDSVFNLIAIDRRYLHDS